MTSSSARRKHFFPIPGQNNSWSNIVSLLMKQINSELVGGWWFYLEGL
jgi:hypothetical protein